MILKNEYCGMSVVAYKYISFPTKCLSEWHSSVEKPCGMPLFQMKLPYLMEYLIQRTCISFQSLSTGVSKGESGNCGYGNGLRFGGPSGMDRNGGSNYTLNHNNNSNNNNSSSNFKNNSNNLNNNNNNNDLGGKNLQGLAGVPRLNQVSCGNNGSVFSNANFTSKNAPPPPALETNSNFLPVDPLPSHHMPYGPPGTSSIPPLHRLVPPPPLDGPPYPTELYAELMKNRAGLGYLPPCAPTSSSDMMPFYDVGGIFPFPSHMYGFRSVR